jgi:hypothetical protein
MTALSRRRLLAGFSASAAAAWLTACTGGSTPNAGAIEQTLANHFGAEIARSEPARRFAEDLANHLKSNPVCTNPWAVCDSPDARIVQSFLESTTFLASRTGAADFDYLTIFDPWTSPCANQLVLPV